jgi:molybdopterin molybdotransferase
VVLSSGGVSVGDYDYVEQILIELGAKIAIQSVAIKPGKPLTFATLKRPQLAPTLYFGLPGNPASALVTFWRFVLPALRKLSGLATGWEPVLVQAQTRQPLRSDSKRETYLWGRLSLNQGQYEFDLAGGSHSSGNLINLAGTNALAILPVAEIQFAPGDWISVMQVR